MTGKRFTLEEFGLNFIVNDNGRILTAKQTVDRLNELNGENEQLKQEAEEYNEDAMSYQTLYEQQLEKFEELLSECKHQQEQKMKFYNENKELKENVSELIHEAIVEILDGQRYEGERILNEALRLLK